MISLLNCISEKENSEAINTYCSLAFLTSLKEPQNDFERGRIDTMKNICLAALAKKSN